MTVGPLGDHGTLDPRWHELICRMPERFVVRTDTVADAAMVKTRSAQVLALRASVAQRVGSDNAAELWF